MTLIKYKQKRNLKKSDEPKPIIKKSSKKFTRFSSEANKKIAHPRQKGKSKKTARLFSFVIHEHHARNLHWDLRLEMNGVLKSWAVPKSPPTAKGTKRLAIKVEDHPLDYANFKGKIPKGQYGAGEVKIWDKGKYEIIEKKQKSMKFKLHGKKLKGEYVLVKTSYGAKPGKSWLFFKTS